MKKLLVIFAVLCLAAPAMAAEWNFYGSARLWTGIKSTDKEYFDVNSATGGGSFDDTDTQWQDLGNSRIGAKVKLSDQISGAFELGFGTPSGGDIYHRKLYGVWNFGDGSLLVGRDYTPIAVFYSARSGDCDENLLNFGAAYEGRRNQIKLTYMDLQVALVEPSAGGVVYETTNESYSGDDTDFLLPKIVVGYNFKTDMMEINPFAGYQRVTYVAQDPDTGDEGEEILSSYVVGVGGKFTFDPVYVNVSVYYAVNPGAYGLAQSAWSQTLYDNESNSFEDNTSMGGLLVAGYKVNDTVTVEAGYGYVKGESDYITLDGTKESTASCYYINVPITLADGFFVVPEISIEDYGDVDTYDGSIDNGTIAYYGVRWQIDF